MDKGVEGGPDTPSPTRGSESARRPGRRGTVHPDSFDRTPSKSGTDRDRRQYAGGGENEGDEVSRGRLSRSGPVSG